MKNLTWQNPEQLFVAQELINKVKSKCCGIKVIEFLNHSNKFILAALSLIVIISILIILRQKEKILPFKRYILKLNKYTMGVYIIHHIIIQEINNSTIGRLYMEYYVLYPILLFILSFVFSLMLTYILQKWKIGRVLFGY